MNLRALIVVAALALSPRLAHSQKVPEQTFQAPNYHAATRITMPAKLGGATLVKSVDYGKTYGDAGLGYSWGYSKPGALFATVYIYRLKNPSIPAGTQSPLVQSQFQEASNDIVASKKYDQLVPIKGPTDCVYGTLVIRCAMQSALNHADQQHVKLGLMLTGFRDHFLKVRIDWYPTAQADAATDQFMQALGAQVGR